MIGEWGTNSGLKYYLEAITEVRNMTNKYINGYIYGKLIPVHRYKFVRFSNLFLKSLQIRGYDRGICPTLFHSGYPQLRDISG